MNKITIQFLLVSICFFGCNSFSTKSPTETVTDFLNSIHEGNFSKTRTLVTGNTSNENIEVLEDLWKTNKNSFTANPSYTIQLETENDDESQVSVKDNNNDFKFQLFKINGSWKIVMRSCGIIDLVRGNPRSDDKGVNEYTVELGDDELSDNTIRQEKGDYPNQPEVNSQTKETVNKINSESNSQNSSTYSEQERSSNNSSSNTYQEPDGQYQPERQRQEPEKIKCNSCNGSGKCPTCSKSQQDGYYNRSGSYIRINEVRLGMVICTHCHGRGTFMKDDDDPCSWCKGQGWEFCRVCNYNGRGNNTGQCQSCKGSGYRN